MNFMNLTFDKYVKDGPFGSFCQALQEIFPEVLVALPSPTKFQVSAVQVTTDLSARSLHDQGYRTG